MIFHILSSIFPIIFIIFLGYFLKEKKFFNENFSKDISNLIINISLPSSIFYSVLKYLKLEELSNLIDKLFYIFLPVIICYIIGFILVKFLNISNGRKGIFINSIVNTNTIFIGMPLNIALFGLDSIPYYLVYYMINTISVWTIGSYIVSIDSVNNQNNKNKIQWNKLFSPSLISFLVAIFFLISKIKLPIFMISTLGYLGNIVTPLSLIYIGISLSNSGIKNIYFDRDTILALIFRFLFFPIIVFIIIKMYITFSIHFTKTEINTYIVQASTPVFAILPMLAYEANGDTEFASNIVTITTLIFPIILPLILLLSKIMF